MNELDKTALEILAQHIELTRLPHVESDAARDIRIMVTARLAELARDIRSAITGAK